MLEKTSYAAAAWSDAHLAKLDDDEVDRFLANPSAYFDFSTTNMFGLTRELFTALQLAGLKRRFGQFRGSLPMLDKLGDSQGVTAIAALDDVLPLLFSHEIYKSYPASLLEKRKFTQMTAWLNKLTTVDLSGVDVSGCKTIDDWMLTLETQSPMSICHTSGTSGTISFLPTTKAEWRNRVAQYPVIFFQDFGEDAGAEPLVKTLPLNIPCIFPYFRSGGLSFTVANHALVDVIAGSEELFYAAYPGRLSADLLLLAAKLRAAQQRGTLDQVEIDPDMLDRRKEFEASQRDMPAHLAEFFDVMRTKLAGQRIFMQASTVMLFSMAQDGLKRGIKGNFAADSVIMCGGGAKGTVLPDDWHVAVKAFFGVDRIHVNYGMSEIAGQFTECEQGNYHGVPWIISYVLDPETKQPLPRHGVTTGQFACYDLLADSHWGGFITGDEVTMDWDGQCGCGRTTPFLHNRFRRLSEIKKDDGGEEKITCAATPQAYSDALDFLNGDVA